MSNKITLYLCILNEKKYYKNLGSISGPTLAETVAWYGKIALKRGFTIHRTDGNFGFYENEKGERLFAELRRKNR